MSLVNAVDQVRVNTDRTASELALVRLANELQEAKSETAEKTKILNQISEHPVPVFGYCFPVGKDKEPDYSKSMFSELGALSGGIIVAIICGALFHWLWFIGIFAAILAAVLPARAARIRKAKEHNASVPSLLSFYHSLLAELHQKQQAIEDEINDHRRLLNSVARQ